MRTGASIIRTGLEYLYRASGALAAMCLASIALVILAQVAANVLNSLSRWLTGASLGLVVPSYADFAGFFLATASFFALAYTLRTGGHIRVSLVIRGLGPRARRAVEIWCACVALLLSGYFTAFMAMLVEESRRFGDMSTGMLAIPIWIPQAAMTLGLAVLTIALLDELVTVLRGERPAYEREARGILADDGEEGDGGHRREVS